MFTEYLYATIEVVKFFKNIENCLSVYGYV